ncbi:hypothetical protein J5N97_023061 [Dioscorea zingiberensis]|uniref:Uncharacterized protein n=1 Tax=Dioscorea zingiberensis TaxID=325984 RepID=A0A9D5CBX9_9LILI|nr:hypothetical protein J5N97_023061 [Dioscorea zingiberensis]
MNSEGTSKEAVSHKEKAKYGSWMTPQWTQYKGRNHNNHRRSSGEEQPRMKIGSRFEVLEKLEQVSEEIVVEHWEQATHSKEAASTSTGPRHVKDRGFSRRRGRGGRVGPALSRGGLTQYAEPKEDRIEYTNAPSQKVGLEMVRAHPSRQTSNLRQGRGRGGFRFNEMNRVQSHVMDYTKAGHMEGCDDLQLENPPLTLLTSIAREDYDKRNKPDEDLALVPVPQKIHSMMVAKIAEALEEEGKGKHGSRDLMELEEPPDPGEQMEMEIRPDESMESRGKRTPGENYHIPKKGRIDHGDDPPNQNC